MKPCHEIKVYQTSFSSFYAEEQSGYTQKTNWYLHKKNVHWEYAPITHTSDQVYAQFSPARCFWNDKLDKKDKVWDITF